MSTVGRDDGRRNTTRTTNGPPLLNFLTKASAKTVADFSGGEMPLPCAWSAKKKGRHDEGHDDGHKGEPPHAQEEN